MGGQGDALPTLKNAAELLLYSAVRVVLFAFESSFWLYAHVSLSHF